MLHSVPETFPRPWLYIDPVDLALNVFYRALVFKVLP